MAKTVNKLTKKVLDNLEVGNVIEASESGLFSNLDNEPLLLSVTNVSKKKVITFDVSYFGIGLGRWACKAGSDRLIWTAANS